MNKFINNIIIILHKINKKLYLVNKFQIIVRIQIKIVLYMIYQIVNKKIMIGILKIKMNNNTKIN